MAVPSTVLNATVTAEVDASLRRTVKIAVSPSMTGSASSTSTVGPLSSSMIVPCAVAAPSRAFSTLDRLSVKLSSGGISEISSFSNITGTLTLVAPGSIDTDAPGTAV